MQKRWRTNLKTQDKERYLKHLSYYVEFLDPDIYRDHICHKQYKQRLCKIIITRVKVHFVDVF